MCMSPDSIGSLEMDPRAPEAGLWFDFQVGCQGGREGGREGLRGGSERLDLDVSSMVWIE